MWRKLLAGKTDEAALEASIRLRNQIATTRLWRRGSWAGRSTAFTRHALDRAIRDANPNATLTTTAAEDVAKFADADVMPFKPQHANNPSEQFQFRTPGGSWRPAIRGAHGIRQRRRRALALRCTLTS